MGIFEAFTARNVLKASGIAILIPSATLIVAPAVLISHIFLADDGKTPKDKYLGRMAGITGAGTALIQLTAPGSRDVLHIAIAQRIACAVVSGNRCQEAEDIPTPVDGVSSNDNKIVTKILFAADILLLISLLIAKKKDDDLTGKPLHEVV